MGKHAPKARKYGVYISLRSALLRDGIPFPGPVATILLDTFIKRRGVLLQEHVMEKNKKDQILCGPGSVSFKVWRKLLETKGWIIYDEVYAKRTKRFADHQPGPKLVNYTNKENGKVNEFATKDDIRDLRMEKADKSEVEMLKEKVNQLELMFNTMATDYLRRFPPDTPERRALFRECLAKGLPFIESDKPRLQLAPM